MAFGRMKPRNVKWDNETECARYLIERTLGCRGRSDTVRTALEFVSEIIEAGILCEVIARVQEKQHKCAHDRDDLRVRTVIELPAPERRREIDYRWNGISTSAKEAREFMGMMLGVLRECAH